MAHICTKSTGRRVAVLALLLAGLWAGAASAATGKSAAFSLDLREGDRLSAGTEELTFSNLWDGDAEATVTIAQDGAAIFTGLKSEGVKTWTVDRNGRYELTHTTYTNGAPGKVETAVFVVEGKDVPVRELTVEWESGSYKYDGNGKTPGVTAKDGDTLLEKGVDYTVHYEGNTNAGTAKAILTGLPPYVGSVTNEFAIAKRLVELTSGTDSKAYDGTPLVCYSVTTNGEGFVAGEGVDFTFTGSQTIVGSSKNTFDYTFKTGTQAGNYTITKTEGDLEVTSGEIVNPFDPDDPTNPATSEDLAKANCITNYDGDGHSVEVAAFLNPLIAANNPQITYSLLRDGTYESQKPVFTNVVSTSVWYRIEADNFNLFTTNALLVISPRSVANATVAAIGDQTYTGSGIEPIPAVTDMRTLVGMSEPTNILTSADYDLSYLNNTNVGTAKIVLSGKNNYEGSQTNTFQIVPAIIPPGPDGAIVATGYTNAYDGAAHGVSVSVTGLRTQPTVQYKGSPSAEWQGDSPTYTDVCDTQVWWKVSAPNYQPVEGTVGLKIMPRPVTLTSGTKTDFAYNGQPHEFPVLIKSENWFVEGEGVATSNWATVTAVTEGEVSNTFDYAPLEGTKLENYDITVVTGKIAVEKGALPPDVKPDPVDPDPTKPDGPYSAFDYVGVYDGEGHTIDTNGLAAAYRAAVGEVSCVYARAQDGSSAPTTGWANEAPVFTNAATNVVWYKVSSANYEDIVHPAKVAIVPRAITIASVDGTWTYDTVAHGTNEVKVTLNGGAAGVRALPEGEDVVVDEASFLTITDVGEKDNTFEWAFAEGTLEGNYAVTVRYGKLKVNARTIGDDDANWDIRLDKAPMYNGEVQSAPIIQVCYVKPDGNLDYIPYELAGNTATDAGNYKVKITGKGNYAGTVEKDWAIMPRNLKMTSGTAEWMYDGETHSNDTVTVTGDGFVEGEGATYAGFPQVLHFADAAEPVENAFTYKLNENTKAKNYEIVTEKGKVAMTRRPITLTAPTKSKTYDGTPLTFTAGDVAIGGEGYAGSDGEGAVVTQEAFALSSFASITEAGQVAATFSIADGTALMDDYDITVTPGATLTVQKSATEITVTAKSKSWTYDGEAHELHEYDATNLGTLVGGDQLEVTFSADSVVTTPIDGENQDGVVENTITSVKVMRGDVDVSDNYTLAWYPGALTVTKRPVTLTSKGAVWTYDGTAHQKKEVEISLTGGAAGVRALPDGEGIVVDESSFASITDVGKAANTFTWHFASGTNAAYYEITKVEGELEVLPADISAGTEPDWEIVLGAAPTYNGIAQIQTVTSVKFKGLDLDYTVSGNQQTDAGDYELTLTGQGNFTGTKTVAWKLNPKPLTLTAGSGSKPYDGTPLTSNAVTPDGFVVGEAATYACAGSQLDVGSSENVVTTINWAKAKASNYAITKRPGTLAVTPRAVTVTSKNISKPFDGTPLKLTAGDIELSCGVPGGHALPAGESFVYGDFAERTVAGQTSATFSIAAGANTKLTNYAITPMYGTITITKSATEIGVTARSKSWPYDATTHELHEYDATNLNILQPGEELVVTFKEASKVTTPKDGPGEDGKVANEIESIRVVKNGSQDVTANYTVTAYPGVLSVTKRPVTVTVEGETVSATYDGEEHTASGYDIATEDELYDIAAKTAFGGTDEVMRTDAGKSEMGLKPSDFTNSDEYFDVTYAVTDGWVDIAQADISAGAEGDFVLTLGANPKYNGTVQTIPVTAVELKVRDGEGAVVTQLPVTYTLAGENATHAGTYTLTVKANGNFKGERSTTWKILKRQVKLTSGSASHAYNGQPLVNGDVAVSGDGFIGVEGATYSVTGSQTVAGSSKNAFTYALRAGTQEGDYDIEKVEGDLTVTKAKYPGQEEGGAGITWNVNPAAATWMYDGSEHGVVVTGVPVGVTPVYVGNKAKDVGTYTASVTFLYDAENYEAPVGPSSMEWSITARPITLSALTKERPYNGLPLSVVEGDITASGNGYAPGERFEYYDFASITDVGEKPATFKYRDSANAKVSNYIVTVTPDKVIKVTVGGDQISVASDSATWAYDGNAHGTNGWSFVNGDKLLAGHEFQIKIADSSMIETPKDGPNHDGIVSNAFEYVRIIETATGNNMTKNYNLFVYEGILKMTNAFVAVEQLSGVENIEKTYDGEPTNVTVTAELLQPATVRYGESVDDISSMTEPEFTNAGEYVVWYTVSAQYYNTYTNKVEVKIDKRPITLTSPTKSKPFDGTSLTFGAEEIETSYTGGAAGGRALPDGESLLFSNFASITDAGRVDATFEYAAGENTSLDNFEVTVEKGTLTVNASAEEIVVTAKSGNWAYDGEEHVLHDCEVENNEVLRSGDELVVEYDPASKVTTPDDGEVDNAIASVRVVRTADGQQQDVTANYSIATYPGKIKVVNATMTVDDSSFATTHVYDGNGHTANVVAPTLLTSPVTVKYGTSSDAVTSSVSPTFKDAGTHTVFYQFSAKYYNVYSGSTTVKITPRPVTLVSAGAERVYDGSPLTKDVVSVKAGSLDFPEGDGYEASCYGTITGVGAVENGFDYALTGAAKSDNYVITKEYGELRITYATLDPAVVLGPMPVSMNLTYDGAEHPFVVEPTFGEAYKMYYAADPIDESAYVDTPIAFKDATVANAPVYFKMVTENYRPLYGTGTVSVARRAVTLTSATASKKFDGVPLVAKTVTVTGDGWAGEEGATYDVTGTQTAVGASKNTFTYSLANGAKKGNYTITKVEGTLKVTQGEVVYTAHGYAAEYDGNGHSIAVSVATPAGLVPRYSLLPEGPYSATLPTFTNACADVVVWYALEADQYAAVTNSATVTIAKRPLTAAMVNAIANQTYTGSGIKPPLTFTDAGNRKITTSDYTTAYSNNKNVGQATVTVTATPNGNYSGAVKVHFNIVKAKINDDKEPGGGSVPPGGVSKFDKTFEYDGKGHSIDAATILAAFKSVVVGGVAECKYALSATPAVWLSTPPVFTNVCTKSIWYKAMAANHEDFVHEVRMTITPRDLAKSTIAPIPAVTYADKPATPVPVVTDGTPSIITANDYTVSYLNNAKPGTATVMLTGKGNYTGTKSANFTIKAVGVKYAALKGSLAWKLNTGTGCYTAQLKLTCTNGFNCGISDLKFVYQDRMNGTKVASGLWDSSTRVYRPTTTIGGTTYRYVMLDASKIAAQNVTALYGVQDVSKSVGTVPTAQCTIELFVGNLASPVSDIGYVMWKSNGTQCSLPISAAGGSQGMTVSQAMLGAVRMAASASMLGAPLSTAALNASLAMGVVIDPASSPYCKLTDFGVTANGFFGRVEVGKEAGGVETRGSLGTNACAVLMGSKNLTDGFAEIGSVPVDESGTFQFCLVDKSYQFFRVRIDIKNVVE